MTKATGGLFEKIQRACEGLIYISETDAVIAPFAGPPADNIDASVILQHLGLGSDIRIEERNFDEFFARLTAVKDWHGEADKTKAKKFLELKLLLEENLRDIKVFRMGTIRIDIFVVGVDIRGRLMGVTTNAVET